VACIKIFILGSCVTRDIFRVVDKCQVVDYYARTTLCSLMSQPLEIKDINLVSEFQRKMIRRDFEKTFFEDTKKADFDFLIVDLIDERFNILQCGKSLITKSSEFVNSGLETLYDFVKIYKGTNEFNDAWKRDAQLFSNKLQSIVPVEKIIIHEAYWAKQYTVDGKLKEYPNQNSIDCNNKILLEYYQTLKQFIPAKVVKNKEFIGDAKHMWGLTPFHYTQDYYEEIYNQIIS
jgi:hypothetical protein